MRIAILSDIHGNREAFEACLAHASRQRAERHVVLGDIVGYGADPGFCTDVTMRLVEAGAVAIKGNHDEALDLAAPDMHAEALAAIAWTRTVLSDVQRRFLVGLPMSHREDDRLFVHASAREPGFWPYLREPRDAELSLGATDARLVVCGHTHLPAIFALQRSGICVPFRPATNEAVPLMPHRRWQVVVGSVGQPRDGSPLASYSILDLAQGSITQHRVAYDHQAAGQKILAAGLPPRLAARLAEGR
jgi:predicted phosphodiesterase